MEIHSDFTQRVVVHAGSQDWIDSPMAGVQRKPLDRIGDEVARATTIVRYLPSSEFSAHIHTGGEEFFVIEGTFEDEHGHFPAGSYIRNPPLSQHQPSSTLGCVMLVKLWQFYPEDRTHLRVQSSDVVPVCFAHSNDIVVQPLYDDANESVSLLTLAAHARLELATPKGAELLVLQGELSEQADCLVKNSWLRMPLKSEISAQAGAQGATIWMKIGHLNQVEAQMKYLQSATINTNHTK